MPTTSCVRTRLRQASGTVALPVRLVIARLDHGLDDFGAGLKGRVAPGSCTATMRAWRFGDESKSAAWPGAVANRSRAGRSGGGREGRQEGRRQAEDGLAGPPACSRYGFGELRVS